MILTNEQIEERISSEENLINQISNFRNGNGNGNKNEKLAPEVIHKNHITNPNGKVGSRNLTEDERVAVGVLSNTVGEDVAADMFGISKYHAHHLRSANRSKSSGEGYKDVELEKKIGDRLEKTRTTIQERAAEKLLGAFALLDEDKLENCSPRDLASISTQMSQVMRNMTDRSAANDKSGKNNVKIIIHQPKPSKEEHFDFIEVKAS